MRGIARRPGAGQRMSFPAVALTVLMVIAACTPAAISSPNNSLSLSGSVAPTQAEVLTVAEAQTLAKATAAGSPVPVLVGGYLLFAPQCEGSAPMPTPTPQTTPDPLIQPCDALFLVTYPVVDGGVLGATLHVAPDRVPDATWAAAVIGWHPVVVQGHFGDPRLADCPAVDKDFCADLLVLDSIVSVGAALPTPTTLDLTTGTPTVLGGAALTVPSGWTITKTGSSSWSISAPPPTGVVFTLDSHAQPDPFDPANGVVSAYPSATAIGYDDSKGYEKWSVEFGSDLPSRRSLVGFNTAGITYELHFAWDAPVDELAQAIMWFRQVAATFARAHP